MICNPGWIPTPGRYHEVFDLTYDIIVDHQFTQCVEGGTWSVDLQCELPLLVIAGGLQVVTMSEI